MNDPNRRPASSPRHSLEDLMKMNSAELLEVMKRGHAIDPEVLAGQQFLGVDLSLPAFARKLLWHTFRKTFVRDDATGELRGWNVKMEQTGIDGARRPLRDRMGTSLTFGHYRLRSALGRRFPKGWSGANYLDYGAGGNRVFDPAKLGYTPLVAVNEGDSTLLLGWEIFRIAGVMLPLPLYWALRAEGPVDELVDPPRAPRLLRG